MIQITPKLGDGKYGFRASDLPLRSADQPEYSAMRTWSEE